MIQSARAEEAFPSCDSKMACSTHIDAHPANGTRSKRSCTHSLNFPDIVRPLKTMVE